MKYLQYLGIKSMKGRTSFKRNFKRGFVLLLMTKTSILEIRKYFFDFNQNPLRDICKCLLSRFIKRPVIACLGLILVLKLIKTLSTLNRFSIKQHLHLKIVFKASKFVSHKGKASTLWIQ